MRFRPRGDGLTVPTPAASVARLAVRAFDMGGGVRAKKRELAEASPLPAVLGTDGNRPWLDRLWSVSGSFNNGKARRCSSRGRRRGCRPRAQSHSGAVILPRSPMSLPSDRTARHWLNGRSESTNGGKQTSGEGPAVGFLGAPGRIRTPDPRIRSPLLCPPELQAHGGGKRTCVPTLRKARAVSIAFPGKARSISRWPMPRRSCPKLPLGGLCRKNGFRPAEGSRLKPFPHKPILDKLWHCPGLALMRRKAPFFFAKRTGNR